MVRVDTDAIDARLNEIASRPASGADVIVLAVDVTQLLGEVRALRNLLSLADDVLLRCHRLGKQWAPVSPVPYHDIETVHCRIDAMLDA